MVVVNVLVESGCSFEKGEFKQYLEAVIQDGFDLDVDPSLVDDCIKEYDGEIKEEIVYSFFLHRANIATAQPGYEPAFYIQQVIENISEVDVQL